MDGRVPSLWSAQQQGHACMEFVCSLRQTVVPVGSRVTEHSPAVDQQRIMEGLLWLRLCERRSCETPETMHDVLEEFWELSGVLAGMSTCRSLLAT